MSRFIRYLFTAVSLAASLVIGSPAMANVVTCDPSYSSGQAYTAYLIPGDTRSAFTVNLGYIFCGNVNSKKESTGFHSRPGGFKPATAISFDPPLVDGAKTNTVYTLTNIVIMENKKKGKTKPQSTMFPDWCSQMDVLNAVIHARRTAKNGKGSSGRFCTEEGGGAFTIQLYIKDGNVVAAFPIP